MAGRTGKKDPARKKKFRTSAANSTVKKKAPITKVVRKKRPTKVKKA